METKWTAAQHAAISQRNKTLLLSAAAGSGKTTTLTERIIRSITDKNAPADISRMLIVTFTRASAADLKTKIFTAVSNALALDPTNKHLASQLIKLGSAKISTIDSFYLNEVRQNFSSLGLSSSFRIADESETVLIANSVMNDVINKFYDTEEKFSLLCESFEQIRSSEGMLEGILLGLYSDCMYTPEGVEYLHICAERESASKSCEFFQTSYGRILTEQLVPFFSDYLSEFEKILNDISDEDAVFKAYYDAFDADRLLCIKALNILENKCGNCSYDSFAELLSNYSHPALGRLNSKFASEDTEFYKEFRNAFKDELSAVKKLYASYSSVDFSQFFQRTAENLDILYRVLTEFDELYMAEKFKRNILELTDIKRYALKLFANPDGTPTQIATALSEQYSDIYIDEYQDVDPVQDLIFRCISTPYNRFMVGDIKQSIYSFRGARPQLFADYRAAFPLHGSAEAENSNSETLFMSENFRCAKPVIDFTNLVCSDIFKACGTSIGYTDADDLICAKASSEREQSAPKVQVALFAKNTKQLVCVDDPSALPSPVDAECMYIASEIKRLLTSEKKQDGTHFVPGDIAVLFRNKKTGKQIADALNAVGIMTTQTESAQYFSDPEVLMMLCILNAIDNPQRDVQLAGAMRSPIFGFTLEDLLLINEYGGASHSLYDKVCLCSENNGDLCARCKDFLNTLEHWRSMSLSMPIDKFLSRIFATDIFIASGLLSEKNSFGEGGNIKRFYEYARTFESGSFKGLYNFIEFINSLIENGKTLKTQTDSFSRDCVTLTTIHKSKGLEFPVCFVCRAASSFNATPASNLTFSYEKGIAMSLSDATGFAYYNSPLKKLLDLDRNSSDTEEEMRVLYVALTRAKERLYVTGSYSTATMPNVLKKAKFMSQLRSPFYLLSASSYMDWILPVLHNIEASKCAELLTFTTDALPSFDISIQTTDKMSDISERNDVLYNFLRKKFTFEYPHTAKRRIPAKLSVSRLSPDVLDNSDNSLELFDNEKAPAVPEFFLDTKKCASAAERGTATHLFLQFCDFETLKASGVIETLAMLRDKGFIPPKTSECVYIEELNRFCESDLMSEILNADKIIREQRFNLLLEAECFSKDKKLMNELRGESIAVQGVIDLILLTKDGQIHLYDYKTDRLTREELASPVLATKRLNDVHALQLSYYATAIERMFGKSPTRVAVYSTHAARLYDITPTDIKLPPDIL